MPTQRIVERICSMASEVMEDAKKYDGRMELEGYILVWFAETLATEDQRKGLNDIIELQAQHIKDRSIEVILNRIKKVQ